MAEWADCKAICLCSEVGDSDLFRVDTTFERRPKTSGLWTRFRFHDGEVLEGVLPHNLLEWPSTGYLIIPPKARASRQRVFIPKLALAATELRGVVGAAAAELKGTEGKASDHGSQLSMFER